MTTKYDSTWKSPGNTKDSDENIEILETLNECIGQKVDVYSERFLRKRKKSENFVDQVKAIDDMLCLDSVNAEFEESLPNEKVQDEKHQEFYGIAQLCFIFFEENDASGELSLSCAFQGYFLDLKTRKPLGIMATEIRECHNFIDCCHSQDDRPITFRFTLVDFQVSTRRKTFP